MAQEMGKQQALGQRQYSQSVGLALGMSARALTAKDRRYLVINDYLPLMSLTRGDYIPVRLLPWASFVAIPVTVALMPGPTANGRSP